MVKTMKETSDRAKTSKCVRFDDKKGFVTKFNKTNIPNELMGEIFYYSVKCVEQVSRGFSPTSVATKKRFQKFQLVSEGLKRKALPQDYPSFSSKKKEESAKKLVDEIYDELAEATSSQQSRVQHPQVQGVDMQVNNPGQIQVDEVPAAAPNPDLGNTLSNDASLQNVAWNQCDNSQGQPPCRPPVPLEEIVLLINDLMYRASRFPGRLPKFEWSEEAFRSFVIQLESVEGVIEDPSTTNSKSHQKELFPPLDLADFSPYMAVTSMPSMESLENEIWSNLCLLRP